MNLQCEMFKVLIQIIYCSILMLICEQTNSNAVRFFNLWTSRCLVYALPSGSTHKLGLKNGLGCPGRKRAQAKATTSTVRSSQMLKSFSYLRSIIHLFLYFFFLFYSYFLLFIILLPSNIQRDGKRALYVLNL